ncbi:MAG: hypothetical protein JWM36_3231 [Hyphomicrobiales bacterium]|nr:hypothetical protein [Hyphomicrobiales bacterium]
MISAIVASETPTAISARDLVVQSFDEPRIPDILLAVRLGFERPRKIRELIERNRAELETYGELPVRVGSPHGGANPKGGRPGKAYFLTEGQALVICALARTPVAAAIRREIIVVFQSYRAWKVNETEAPDAWRDMMVVRGLLERGVETLLDLLNVIDANPDDEDDREGDSVEEEGEPSLGAPELDCSYVGDQTNWARGSGCDAEQDDTDHEPSLASSNERSDQTSWGWFGNDRDIEEEHNGREPDTDGEPTLGSTEDVAKKGLGRSIPGPLVTWRATGSTNRP